MSTQCTAALPLDEPFRFIVGARIISTPEGDAIEPQEYSHPGECHLRLFPHAADKSRLVAIITDTGQGPDAGQFLEDVAAQVTATYSLDPVRVVWILHYDKRLRGHVSAKLLDSLGRVRQETFSLISFRYSYAAGIYAFSDSRGTGISKQSVENMIGKRLL